MCNASKQLDRMLPFTSAAAKQKSAAEEWQALAHRMGTAIEFGAASSDDARMHKMQDALRHLPQHWTPGSADQPHSIPQQVVIYDAAHGVALLAWNAAIWMCIA